MPGHRTKWGSRFLYTLGAVLYKASTPATCMATGLYTIHTLYRVLAGAVRAPPRSRSPVAGSIFFYPSSVESVETVETEAPWGSAGVLRFVEGVEAVDVAYVIALCSSSYMAVLPAAIHCSQLRTT
jgi:hypothetical protein